MCVEIPEVRVGEPQVDGGGHKFTWKLVEPRKAEEKELPK